MIKCTLVHSAYDPATEFASQCAKEVRELLLNAKFEIFEFFGADSCVKRVHGHLQNSSSEIQGFLNYGHGNEETLFGNNNEVLFDVKSVVLLTNKICFVLACSAAKKLGEEIVKNGGICFLGFNNDFHYSLPYEDVFRTCVNSGMKAMIAEKVPIGKAFEKMKATFDEMISKLISSRGFDIWLAIVLLREDKKCMRLIGDHSASLWLDIE